MIRLSLAMVLALSWMATSPTLAQVPGPPETGEECPSTFGPIITDTAVPKFLRRRPSHRP